MALECVWGVASKHLAGLMFPLQVTHWTRWVSGRFAATSLLNLETICVTQVTYHGPGQLVMYPILDLKQLTQDLHWYLRSLEEVVIRWVAVDWTHPGLESVARAVAPPLAVCSYALAGIYQEPPRRPSSRALEAVSGLEGQREEGRTGVWVAGRKLAAIGVRARRWVTCHGLAFNVTPDLRPFSSIVPCGIPGREVGSVWEASRGAGDARQASTLEAQQSQLLQEYAVALLEAAEDVFGLQFVPGGDAVELLRAPPGALESAGARA